jgi:TolB-like protein/Tfp pilus assembly protein PilF
LAVSGTAYDHLQGKVGIALEFAGEQQVKNIARPVRVYRARLDRLITDRPTLALPDKPSIAVLPFANLSRDPEQEYFADGIVDELITALSRFRHLFVIARNSSFTYKGRAVDVKLVGRELGVRYVLEGSVRKSGNRVRISGQLIDAATGAHLWADRFEGTLDDIFELQDHVTASVVGAISPRLEEAEIERAQRKPTESLDAYDYFLRGMAAFHQWTREGSTEALSNFYHAIEIDPKFASAYGMAARCYPQRKTSGWVMDAVGEAAEAERLARRAAALGRDDATALSTAGFTLAYIGRGLDEGDTLIDRALQLNPNLAWAWLCSGWVKVWLGKPELALEQLARSMRLSPHDPQLFRMQTAIAYAHFSMGQFSEALSWAEKAFLERPDQVSAVRILAASSAIVGQQDRAMQALERLRELDPTLRLSNLKNVLPLRRPEILNSLTEGLRKAGLPE